MPFLRNSIQESPRAIIFDVGRVIIPVDMSRAFAALGKGHGASHLQVLRELEADSHWPDWQEGRMSPQEWHARMMEKFKLQLSFQEFCAIWNSVLGPDTILPDSFFERLATRHRLALLSNTDPIHVAHFEATFPFVLHFATRIYSCRVGLSKPSPMIFHHTLRELDALPEESLFVDDMLGNVKAAADLGINAFHFTGPEDLLTEFSRLGL